MSGHRVGLGSDLHRLAPGRPLVIGGVTVPAESGAVGHSDADVLLHALTDALLGAVGAGDIGRLFPDEDPAYSGADSRIFVARALDIARERGYAVVNADLTVVLERPKLGERKEEIRAAIAVLLDVDPRRVNVKAKTMEGTGAVGRGEAVAAQAVVLLERRDK